MKSYLFVGLPLCALFLFSSSLLPLEVFGTGLDNSDCIKCHAQVVADVDGRGLKHKTAVTCLDCHLEHPPEGTNAIPECAMCHAKDVKSHYAVEECVTCHSPHYPLEINFAKVESIKPVCSSCHENEGGQLVTYPSLHSELDCTECHTEHGTWQSCLDCHEGHSADMVYETCLRCHQPHMPSVVKYDTFVPNNWCSGCHEDVVDTLAGNRTKHHKLLCVYCHKDQHMMMPTCETCHGEPHGLQMHKKYPDCAECHYGPHALDK